MGSERSVMKKEFKHFKFNPPASSREIARLRDFLGMDLPEDYLSFMMKGNGGEGWIGEKYLMLWPIEELLAYHQAYQMSKYAPGFLLFGSNGGLEAFAFDTRIAPVRIVSIPFIGFTPSEAIDLGTSFSHFLETKDEQ